MFSDPFCSQNSSGTLITDRANNQLFGILQQLGRASKHFSDETFALDCITFGQIRLLMSVTLLSRESQISPVEL